jgi:hypothetical protein
MVTIGKAQMEAIAKETAEHFPSAIALILRTDFPGLVKALSDQALKDKVGQGVARARAHRLETRSDILEFVCLLFVIDWEFDQREPFRSIFADTPPCIAMNVLFSEVTTEDWRRAATGVQSRQA